MKMKFTVLYALLCLIYFSIQIVNAEEQSVPQTALADTDTQVIFERGKDALFDFQLKHAEELFSLCVKREPKNVNYICWLAQTKGFLVDDQHRQGKSDLALFNDCREVFGLYEKALELDPTTERARLGEAVRLRLTPWIMGGNDEKAEQILNQLAKDFPKSIFPLHELGILYFKEKDDYKTALKYYLQTLELAESKPLSEAEKFWLPRTYHQVGHIYLNKMDQPKTAIPYLEKAFSNDKNYVEFGLDLAEAYRKTNQEEKAIEVLERSAQTYYQNEHKKFKNKLLKIARQLDLNQDWQKKYNLL